MDGVATPSRGAARATNTIIVILLIGFRLNLIEFILVTLIGIVIVGVVIIGFRVVGLRATAAWRRPSAARSGAAAWLRRAAWGLLATTTAAKLLIDQVL